MTNHCSRRWFQLSLKSLFLLTLLVATFLAGYSVATKQADVALQAEREARTKLERAHVELVRDLIKLNTDFGTGTAISQQVSIPVDK